MELVAVPNLDADSALAEHAGIIAFFGKATPNGSLHSSTCSRRIIASREGAWR
jgi:hypothetical protein